MALIVWRLKTSPSRKRRSSFSSLSKPPLNPICKIIKHKYNSLDLIHIIWNTKHSGGIQWEGSLRTTDSSTRERNKKLRRDLQGPPLQISTTENHHCQRFTSEKVMKCKFLCLLITFDLDFNKSVRGNSNSALGTYENNNKVNPEVSFEHSH